MLLPPKTAARIRRRISVVAAAALLLWLLIALQLFVNVARHGPDRADAVIMLAGASLERLPVAQRLQTELRIPVLVLSNTNTTGNAAADRICNTAAFPSESLLCFEPDGYDTRGEARVIGELIAENGWQSVIIVTSQYHVTRAEVLIEQCVDADVQMVASYPELDPGEWLRRLVVESGGLMDAAFRPECSKPVA